MSAPALTWPAGGEVAGAIALGGGELHVWSASLAAPPERVAAYEATLADDERARAARFRFPLHRDRYVVGRGVLRALLARYTGAAPAALHFRYAANGKPALDAAHDRAPHFNVSHADDVALYALSARHELGVDVERVHEMDDLEAVAAGYYSAAERDELRAVPAGDRALAFFNCWTRKEAYIKATGEGLSCPLDRFDVTLAPGAPARIRAIAGSAAAGSEWTVLPLAPAPGYVGAVALRGPRPRALCRRWE